MKRKETGQLKLPTFLHWSIPRLLKLPKKTIRCGEALGWPISALGWPISAVLSGKSTGGAFSQQKNRPLANMIPDGFRRSRACVGVAFSIWKGGDQVSTSETFIEYEFWDISENKPLRNPRFHQKLTSYENQPFQMKRKETGQLKSPTFLHSSIPRLLKLPKKTIRCGEAWLVFFLFRLLIWGTWFGTCSSKTRVIWKQTIPDEKKRDGST